MLTANMRILVVEDDRMIGASLVSGLQDEGYAVDWVRDGLVALATLGAAGADYAIVLLDWFLPGSHGLSVLKALRGRGDDTPVVMITARAEAESCATGLDHGADDYLIKPFEFLELKARIRSVLRRRCGRPANKLTHGLFALDRDTRSVSYKDRSIALSLREFALLEALLERPGAVLSRLKLEQRIYAPDQPVHSNAIEFIIHGLRRKLDVLAIENVRGTGWRIGGVL